MMDEKIFDPFTELLAVLDTEQLIRLRHRLLKKGKLRTAQILTDEIRHREKVWGGEDFPAS